jgi:hypothetical protein
MYIGNPRWPSLQDKILMGKWTNNFYLKQQTVKIIVNHPKGSYVKTLSFGDGHLGFPIIHAQFLLISL